MALARSRNFDLSSQSIFSARFIRQLAAKYSTTASRRRHRYRCRFNPTQHRSTMVSSTVLLVVRIVVALATLAMICSPSILMRRIFKQKHVGVASVVPLVALLANAHTWLLYGYLTKNWFPVVGVFVFGDIVAVSYLAIYWRYTTERCYVARVLAAVGSILLLITIYVVVGVLGYTGQTRAQVAQIMGFVSDVAAVCLYAAPQEKLLQVLKHKSAVFINIHMVIAGTTSNCAWFTYGVLTSNWFIISPNVLFITLGTTTMVLYAVYNPKTHPLGDGCVSHSETDEDSIVVAIELSPRAELDAKNDSNSEYKAMQSPLPQ